MIEKWYITEQTFPELLNRNALRFGSRRAQWWKVEGAQRTATLTYAELWRLVKEAAAGLMELGFEKGDRGAVMAYTSPQWTWADYAVICAAGVSVSIYPTLSAKEVVYMLNDSGAKYLFVHDEAILERVIKARGQMGTLQKIVLLSGDNISGSPDVLTFEELRRLGVKLLSRQRLAFEKRWRSVELTDMMNIVYTSGTTGQQKGVIHTHLSFNAACCRDLRIVPPYRPGDVLLSFLPLAHTYERECGHGSATMAAATIAYSSPQTLVEDLQLFKPTVFMSVPRIYERIYLALRDLASRSPLKKRIFDFAMKTGLQLTEARADDDGFVDMSEGVDFTRGVGLWLKIKYKLADALIFKKVRAMMGGRFRFAFSAAGSLSADLCKVFMAMGLRIFEGYGSTETYNTVNLNPPHKVLPGSIGSLCNGVEGRINEIGEWEVRGENIFLGYWNNPAATREAFTEDGFYKTGDIVEELPNGYLKIIDRIRGIMVLDTGKNVPVTKIESLFAIADYVDQVVPIADERPYVSALIVPNFEAVIAVFEKEGIDYDRAALKFEEQGDTRLIIEAGEELIDHPRLRQLLDEEVAEANLELEEHEQIKKYVILHRRLTEGSGEVTPTLKLKRHLVLSNFSREIEGIYEGGPAGAGLAGQGKTGSSRR